LERLWFINFLSTIAGATNPFQRAESIGVLDYGEI
jgi:hypothetical protein